ncbi:hypothetical protein GCM10027186_22460 [Micromonospora schwarzwaldensis]
MDPDALTPADGVAVDGVGRGRSGPSEQPVRTNAVSAASATAERREGIDTGPTVSGQLARRHPTRVSSVTGAPSPAYR